MRPLNLTLLLFAFVISSCVPKPALHEIEPELRITPKEESEPVYSMFLVGDAGKASKNPLEPSLAVLKDKMAQLETPQNSAVIFVGDNIYPDGLPPKGHPERTEAEGYLDAQLSVLMEYEGEIIFLAGNHDWQTSGEDGLEWVKDQERYIEYKLQKNVFHPEAGFAGPVEVKLLAKTDSNPGITAIVYDSQWWIHPHEKKLSDGIETVKEEKERLLKDIEALVEKNKDTHVFIFAHHPLMSAGPHGGQFPWITHLAPPVFGSGYVWYRKLFGTSQDISGYKDLVRPLKNIMKKHSKIAYVSGHEHNLQHFERETELADQDFIVSGSASKNSYSEKLKSPDYAYPGEGIGVIHYYESGVRQLEFWSYEGQLLYRSEF